VLLVDDHPSVLEGIQSYLRTKGQVKVIGQAVDGVEAVEKARKLRPEVVLMDLSLPRMSGLKALQRIHEEAPRTKLMVYTMHESKEYVRAVMRAGALGYALKSSSLSELLRAIESVRDGKIYVDSELSRSDLRPPSRAKPGSATGARRVQSSYRGGYGLTQRERQILEFFVDGLTIKEIGAELQISYHTVVAHLRHIYGKLRVHNRGASVAKALKEHLL